MQVDTTALNIGHCLQELELAFSGIHAPVFTAHNLLLCFAESTEVTIHTNHFFATCSHRNKTVTPCTCKKKTVILYVQQFAAHTQGNAADFNK